MNPSGLLGSSRPSPRILCVARCLLLLALSMGATVMVGDRQKPPDAERDGLLYTPCDVADVKDLEGLMSSSMNKIGHVDIW